MYRQIIRPLLFLIDPERIHHIVFRIIKLKFRFPGIAVLAKSLLVVNDEKLKQKIWGLTFNNPVGLAAGFDKDARLYDELACLGFGFVEIGTLTPVAQPGNPKPRMFRLPLDKGLINRMGFNNEGVTAAAKRLKKRKEEVMIGGNIGKNKVTPNAEAIHDYEKCFETLFDYVDYFVVNVSSPNTPGLRELQEKEPLMALLNRMQELNNEKKNRKPVLLKIAPDLTNEQLDDIIDIVISTKTDGLIATNTTIGRDHLKTDREQVLAMGEGGLSGKPLANRATEVIRYIAEKSQKAFPIIGVGGIHTPEDAIEKLKAGADLIQLYTGFIYEGPTIVKKINEGILKAIESGELKLKNN